MTENMHCRTLLNKLVQWSEKMAELKSCQYVKNNFDDILPYHAHFSICLYQSCKKTEKGLLKALRRVDLTKYLLSIIIEYMQKLETG